MLETWTDSRYTAGDGMSERGKGSRATLVLAFPSSHDSARLSPSQPLYISQPRTSLSSALLTLCPLPLRAPSTRKGGTSSARASTDRERVLPGDMGL